jgi:hypothetical protein
MTANDVPPIGIELQPAEVRAACVSARADLSSNEFFQRLELFLDSDTSLNFEYKDVNQHRTVADWQDLILPLRQDLVLQDEWQQTIVRSAMRNTRVAVEKLHDSSLIGVMCLDELNVSRIQALASQISGGQSIEPEFSVGQLRSLLPKAMESFEKRAGTRLPSVKIRGVEVESSDSSTVAIECGEEAWLPAELWDQISRISHDDDSVSAVYATIGKVNVAVLTGGIFVILTKDLRSVWTAARNTALLFDLEPGRV